MAPTEHEFFETILETSPAYKTQAVCSLRHIDWEMIASGMGFTLSHKVSLWWYWTRSDRLCTVRLYHFQYNLIVGHHSTFSSLQLHTAIIPYLYAAIILYIEY